MINDNLNALKNQKHDRDTFSLIKSYNEALSKPRLEKIISETLF